LFGDSERRERLRQVSDYAELEAQLREAASA